MSCEISNDIDDYTHYIRINRNRDPMRLGSRFPEQITLDVNLEGKANSDWAPRYFARRLLDPRGGEYLDISEVDQASGLPFQETMEKVFERLNSSGPAPNFSMLPE